MSFQRLVTQFDDSRLRATVATPTCSSCCCCCCCVATIISTSAVTAMNLSDLNDDAHAGPAKRSLSVLAAVLALPISLAIGVAVAFSGVGIVAIGIVAVIWLLILRALYRSAGMHEPSKVIGLTVGIGSALLTGELFAGLTLLLSAGTSGALIYLIISIAAVIILIPFLRKLSKPMLVSEYARGPSLVQKDLTPHTVVSNDEQPPQPPTQPPAQFG